MLAAKIDELTLTPLVLIARLYEVFPLLCPMCGGQMLPIAFITHSPDIGHILNHIGWSPNPCTWAGVSLCRHLHPLAQALVECQRRYEAPEQTDRRGVTTSRVAQLRLCSGGRGNDRCGHHVR